MDEIKTISISDFKTHSGAFYPLIKLHYQKFGLEIGKAPIVLINHSLTGDSQLTGNDGWWNEIIGPNKTIDTNRYTILGFNVPGNGILNQTISKPEDFHTGDIDYIFLEDLKILKIKKLYALVGGPIGGGIAPEMVAKSNQITDFLIPAT